MNNAEILDVETNGLSREDELQNELLFSYHAMKYAKSNRIISDANGTDK